MEECKNQLTKANELIHQYRLALEDSYKQLDSVENVNKILKDEVGFLKGELEQTNKFKDTREKLVDFHEADRREKDVERRFTSQLNDKDKQIATLASEVERYKNRILDFERKNKEYVEKISTYEGSLMKLNRE